MIAQAGPRRRPATPASHFPASRARLALADKRLLGLGLLPSFVSRFSRNCTSSTKKAVLQLGVNGKLINIKTVFFFLVFYLRKKIDLFQLKKAVIQLGAFSFGIESGLALPVYFEFIYAALWTSCRVYLPDRSG